MDRRTVTGNLLTVVAGGGVAALIGATTLPKSSPYSPVLFELGGLALIAGIIGFLAMFIFQPRPAPIVEPAIEPVGKPQVSIRLKTAKTEPSESQLLPPNVTPSFLMKLCENKTDIQCEAATALYVGKKLKISGKLYAASNLILGQTSVSISLVEGRSLPTAYLVFPHDGERIAVLPIGSGITAIGTLQMIGVDELRLVDCRLVD